MNWLDYLIVIVYAVGFLFLGNLFRNQKSKSEYFLGGKSFGWLPLSLSMMATQLSAISFISAPAFVGIRKNGGLQWLSFEFGVPLAMIFLAVFLLPKLYKSDIISIYEYLERRFSRSTRLLISIVFQISRSFGTAIMVYAVSLILMSILNIPFWQTILVIGIITLIYSYQGGMKAVVYGDMIQMIILVIGIAICCVTGWHYINGWEGLSQNVDLSRLNAVNFDVLGINGDGEFGFFPMVFGGFCLYASYYGTDQSQVQRLLSAKDLKTVQKTLLFNGILRFPITLLYCFMGLIIGTFVLITPKFQGQIPSDKADMMIPVFIRDYLPHGVIGLLIVAILSAAMSSLSSAINSLSATTTEDMLVGNKEVDEKTYTRYSKLSSLFWGFTCILLAFFAGDIADTVIEAINKIGSVFYGPILATFIVAVGIRSIRSMAMNLGLVAGVGLNIFFWLIIGDQLFWFWWNFIGMIVTLAVAYLVTIILGSEANSQEKGEKYEAINKIYVITLIVAFVTMVLISLSIKYWF